MKKYLALILCLGSSVVKAEPFKYKGEIDLGQVMKYCASTKNYGSDSSFGICMELELGYFEAVKTADNNTVEACDELLSGYSLYAREICIENYQDYDNRFNGLSN